MSWGEIYYDHFERFLGKPRSVSAYSVTGGHRIQILEYRAIEDCFTFCSLGLSKYWYTGRMREVLEVICTVDDGKKVVPDLLGSVLTYMAEKPVTIKHGSCVDIENLDSSFVSKFKKAALYFTHPYALPEGFNSVAYKGEKGHIYFACFLTKAEFNYLSENGPSALEEVFDATEPDLFDLKRPSCV